MMQLATSDLLEHYLSDDWVASIAEQRRSQAGAVRPKSQQWLDEAAAKRMLFAQLYGDLLRGRNRLRLLDVGGGLTLFTAALARCCDYTLVEPMHHDDLAVQQAVLADAPPFQLIREDWSMIENSDAWDVIVANDLFPNVDQRLGAFLAWAAPRARELRVSVTFYNNGRSYQAQRVGGDEMLTVLAFDGRATRDALAPYAGRIAGWSPALFDANDHSLFGNGRQIVTLSIRGDA